MATEFSESPLQKSIQYSYDILCDICDKRRLASWSCNTCVQKLCEKCKNNHKKITYTKSHRILPLLDRHESLGHHAVVCKEHLEPIIYFCEDCSKEICRICQSNEHKGHQSQDIAEHAKKIRNEIEKEFDSKRHLIMDTRKRIGESLEDKEKYDNQSKSDITKVKKTLDSLFRDFKNQAKGVIEDVEKAMKRSEDNLEVETDATNHFLDEAEKEMNELLASYRRQPDAGLGTYWKDTLQPKMLDIKLKVNTSFDRIEFSESKFDGHISTIKQEVDKLAKCFKGVKVHGKSHQTSYLSIRGVKKELKHSFTLKGNIKVYSLSVHKEMIWIGLCRKGNFRVELFSAVGDCLRQKSINFPPLHLLLIRYSVQKDDTPYTGDLLITSGVQSSYIRILKENGFIADFKDVAPFLPFGMCCTSDGHIFVSLQKSEFAGKVLQLSKSGETVREFFLHDCFTPTRLVNTPSGVIVKSDCFLINLKGNITANLHADDSISSVCGDSQGDIFGAGIDSSTSKPFVIRIQKSSREKYQLPFVGTRFVADIAYDIDSSSIWVASAEGTVLAVDPNDFIHEK